MTLYEFNLLSLPECCQFIWEQGVYLATRELPGFKINLYHVKNFYSEVWYDCEKNEIKRVNSFESKEGLEPYVELIKLEIWN